MVNKNFYNTILSLAYSPCGNYLVSGDIYGQISVFCLSKIISPETSLTKDDQKSKNQFTVEEDVPINSLLSTESNLIVGTVGEIIGFNWRSVKMSKEAKPVWMVTLPNVKDSFEKADINCLIYSKENEHLYAGCGDNNIYCINLGACSISQIMRGHNDYIHSIFIQGHDLISGGEDGIVNMWDIREKNPVNKIEPYKNDKIARSEVGKWIGAVCLNNDWLLCGGGPRLSLWHYRFLNNSTIFPINDQGIHVALFNEDHVFSGGRSNLFYKMSFNGDIISEIPTSSVSVYTAVLQTEPFTSLCFGGSSPKIDICSNLNYKDQVLSLI